MRALAAAGLAALVAAGCGTLDRRSPPPPDAAAVPGVTARPPAGVRPGVDDTQWLQRLLDLRAARIFLPRLPGGACYATRGLWISHSGTRLLSDGACLRALGPGPVRLRSEDGDPIASTAVLFVSRSSSAASAPAHVTIAGLRVVVPEGVRAYGIAIFGRSVTVRRVRVEGSPVDAVLVSGRANGLRRAEDVRLLDSDFVGGTRNVISATAVVGLRIERCLITGASDTNLLEETGRASGNPAAGIDLEPDHRDSPMVDVRIARNRIVRNAGPGVLLALHPGSGPPLRATDIEIVGNRIVGNGIAETPPQRGGIVVYGGQADGRGRVVLRDNVIRDNNGPDVVSFGRIRTRIVV